MATLVGDPKQHADDEFKDGLQGHCLCGSINVTINDKELFSRPRGHLCHCWNCRKVAGSFVASNLIIEEAKVNIEDRNGTLKEFIDTQTGSGKPLSRYFCGACGNPIKSVTPSYPGKVVLKMGIFPRIPKPEAETFGIHKHDWQGKHEGLDVYKIKIFADKLES
ncbi:Procollagen galactosyltransferase 1 [Sphaceloma murrayae]|uniref:Procollagen galactosyltransferase 1 n=1 Tax=Sphaceloma murrayae TaxID=2082308 RepID=A0A2K1R0W8_9PEZI|nr:Procollagen galactosyltransferase 1 [Sphaceloma murrayae]